MARDTRTIAVRGKHVLLPEPPRKGELPEEWLAMAASMWLDGRSTNYIRAALRNNFQADLSEKQVRRIVDKVKARLAKRKSTDPAAAKARAEEMFLETYDLARNQVKRVRYTTTNEVGEKVKKYRNVATPDVRAMTVVTERLATMLGAMGDTGPVHGIPAGAATVVQLPEEDEDK